MTPLPSQVVLQDQALLMIMSPLQDDMKASHKFNETTIIHNTSSINTIKRKRSLPYATKKSSSSSKIIQQRYSMIREQKERRQVLDTLKESVVSLEEQVQEATKQMSTLTDLLCQLVQQRTTTTSSTSL